MSLCHLDLAKKSSKKRFNASQSHRSAPLFSGVGSLYVAREVAGDGHGDDERGADPEGAPKI